MKIGFVISSLRAGGAEKVASILANQWAAEGHSVCVISYVPGEDFFPVNTAVTRIRIPFFVLPQSWWERIRGNWRRVRALRARLLAESPDVVVSFISETNILTMVATVGTGIPVVLSERIDVRYCQVGHVLSLVRRMTYPRASAVVLQTRAAAEAFSYLKAERRAVIPNPVLPPDDRTEPALGQPRPFVMAIGRLVEQKGFDLLLTSFAKISVCHPEWRLYIVGDGPLRGALERQASGLGIASNVQFLGVVKRPFETLCVPDIFVLSSRFEGYPNVLCEAMAHGAACVSFDCPSGPSEIISNGYDGLLVPAEDTDVLADAIERLIVDPTLRSRIASHAPRIVERLNARSIANEWLQLFAELAGKSSDFAAVCPPATNGGPRHDFGMR